MLGVICLHFSVGVEYALHCLLHLIDPPSNQPVGIKQLAHYQGVSETYLGKVFTRLKKAGIVTSTPGVKGGYQLARNPEKITFLDVVEALEGKAPLFQCKEIRQNCVIYRNQPAPDWMVKDPCLIKCVMHEAEQKMKSYLATKTLAWLHEELKQKIPAQNQTKKKEWFKQALS